MALHEQPVAIAVIGVTGSGKSTFINLASGSNLPCSNSLGSRTTELKSATFSLDGRTVTLIDTPGFDDTTQNVLNVLKLISDSFSGLLRGVKLAGVIYMHRLTEDRLSGPSGHSFLIFRKFCGDASLRDVFIVANGWSKQKTSGSEGREREVSLKDDLFGPAIDKGARMLRHDGSQASAHAILRHLINRESAAPSHGDACDRGTRLTHPTTEVDGVRKPPGRTGDHAEKLGSPQGRIGAEMVAEEAKTKDTQETRQENDKKNAWEEVEQARCNLKKMVTNFAVEKSRLEDENRRYKEDFSAQKAETELRIRLLGEERKARELAELELERAEAQLARERVSWERHRMERESSNNHAGPMRDKLFVCGALVFALVCVSRFVFDGSTLLR